MNFLDLSRGALLMVGCLLAGVVQAMSFTPIEMDFAPSGRGSTQVYRLENTNPEPAAVEISMKRRQMSISGADELTDADEHFNVFPAQVVLAPGQVQVVRVQYVGPANLNAEVAYRLIAEQLPVDVGQAAQNGGRMRLLVKYVASVYVMPSGARAQIRLGQSRLVNDATGRWLELEVVNDGTSRQILREAKLVLGEQSLSGEALKGLVGENVLAKTTRVFRVPAPANLTALPGSVRLVLP